MQPNDSLADAIGLIGYATTDDGIGGVLKSRVADFRVDEIATTVALNPKGGLLLQKLRLQIGKRIDFATISLRS